jgi:hypothetical protein
MALAYPFMSRESVLDLYTAGDRTLYKNIQLSVLSLSFTYVVDRYYLLTDKGEKIEQQTVTVRTNCVDCLDRTNVTQAHTSIFIFFL